jgi:hypothetical protein
VRCTILKLRGRFDRPSRERTKVVVGVDTGVGSSGQHNMGGTGAEMDNRCIMIGVPVELCILREIVRKA